MGTPEDMQRRLQLARVDDEAHRSNVKRARDLIFKKNHAVSSDDVEKLLKPTSSTPTAVSKYIFLYLKQSIINKYWPQNAFSKRLAPFGFNIFLALMVDLMHEFELGVWKALFIHLLRIIQAHDKKTKRTMYEFNRR